MSACASPRTQARATHLRRAVGLVNITTKSSMYTACIKSTCDSPSTYLADGEHEGAT